MTEIFSSIIASDYLEDLIKRNAKGRKILDKIFHYELGEQVIVTNVTLMKTLQKIQYKEKFLNSSIRHFFYLPQDEFINRSKRLLVKPELIRERAWGLAINWYLQYCVNPNDKILYKIDMDLAGWLDIGMIKWFAERKDDPDKKGDPFNMKIPVTRIITKNKNYELILKNLSKEDKTIPEFHVINE